MNGIVNNKFIFAGLSFPIFLDISPSGFSVVTQAGVSGGVVVPLFFIYSCLILIIFAKFAILVGILSILFYSPLFFIFDLPLALFAQAVLFFVLFDVFLLSFRSLSKSQLLYRIKILAVVLCASQALVFFYQPSLQGWEQDSAIFLPFGFSIYNYFQYFSFLFLFLFIFFYFYQQWKFASVVFFFSIIASYHSDNFTALILSISSAPIVFLNQFFIKKCKSNKFFSITLLFWCFGFLVAIVLPIFAYSHVEYGSFLNGRMSIWSFFLEVMISTSFFEGGWFQNAIGRTPHSQFVFWMFYLGIFSAIIPILLFRVFHKLPAELAVLFSALLVPICMIAEILSHPHTATFLAFVFAASCALGSQQSASISRSGLFDDSRRSH